MAAVASLLLALYDQCAQGDTQGTVSRLETEISNDRREVKALKEKQTAIEHRDLKVEDVEIDPPANNQSVTPVDLSRDTQVVTPLHI